MSRIAKLVVAASLLLWPSLAHAQGVARGASGPIDRGWVEVGGVTTVEPTSPDVVTAHVAPSLAAGVRIAGPVALTLDATFGVTSYRVAGRERVTVGRWGNPFVAVHLLTSEGASPASPAWSGRVGLGAAPPLVTVPGTIHENAAADVADRVALAARGFEAPWLWADNAIPVVVLAAGTWRLGERVELAVDVQPAVVASVNRRPGRLAIDAAAALRYRVETLVPELRLHGYAQSEPIEDGDLAQTSATVAITHEGDGWWVRSGATVNLDGPSGLGDRNATGMGLSAAVGAAF